MRRGMPGIVWRAMMVVNPHPSIGKLHRIGLAQQDHASLTQCADDRGIARCNVVLEQRGTGRGWQTFDIKQILGGIGNAVQRPDLQTMTQGEFCSPRLGQGAFTRDEAEGVQGIVKRFETGKKMFG